MCTGRPFTPRSRRSQFDNNSEPSFSCKWNKSYQVKILLKEIHLNGHYRIFHKLANSKVRTIIQDPIINSGSDAFFWNMKLLRFNFFSETQPEKMTSLVDQSSSVRVFAVTNELS